MGQECSPGQPGEALDFAMFHLKLHHETTWRLKTTWNNSWAQSHSSLKVVNVADRIWIPSAPEKNWGKMDKATWELPWRRVLRIIRIFSERDQQIHPRLFRRAKPLFGWRNYRKLMKEAGIFGAPNFTENPLDGSGGLNFRVAWGGSRFGSGTSWLSVTKRSTFADWEVVTSCFL